MAEAGGDRQSASIANSKIHVRGLSAGFMPVFQTLRSWEAEPHPRLVTSVGILLEAFQFLSLALCPYFLFRQPIISELVQFVWGSSGPLWYRGYGPLQYDAYSVVFLIGTAVVVLTIALFVLLVTKTIESTNITASNTARQLAESVAGWLFLPLLHLFLGGMNCGSDGTLINFPDEVCWTGLHTALLLIGIGSVLGTVAVGYVITATLCDVNPQSTYLKSRAHNYVEMASLIVRTALVIFFHILVERNIITSYNILVVLGATALLVMHAYYLPFYHHPMNAIRCATYAATAFVAVVNCITAYSGPWFSQFNINSFIVAALLPFAAYGGYVTSNLRINPEFTEKLHRLLHNATVPTHKARFPFVKGDMSNDGKLVPVRFKTLEVDIINEQPTGGGPTSGGEPTWEEIVTACSELLVPYIEYVQCSTDAEVACRFVRLHMSTTNLQPTANALAFATRIFLKSIVRYKRSGIARFHFANFLYVFANRLNLALELLNEIDAQVHDEHDALVLYASFKVGVRVKELFGVRDNTHIHTFQRARQYHRDSLADMASFWAKLMESKGDIVGLAMLTNQLTEKRQCALDEYDRALMSQKGDRVLLTAFASFLEHVMCDPVGAEAYRAMADEVAEEKKSRIMRGSRSKLDAGGGGGASHHTQVLDEDDEEENELQSSSAQTLLRNLTILLAVVGIASVGIFVLQEVRISTSQSRLQAISSQSRARAYAEETVLNGLLANQAWQAAGCTNATCTDSTFRLWLYNMSLSEVSMRLDHNKATYGDDAVSQSYSAMSYVSSIVQDILYRPSGSLWKESLFSVHGVAPAATTPTIWQEATSLKVPIEPWMFLHAVSTTATALVNSMYDGVDFTDHFLLLSSNRLSDGLVHLGITAQHQISDIDRNAQGFRGGLIGAVVVGLLVIVACYVAFYSSLFSAAHHKSIILKLFTLIPYPTQEMLQVAATNRIEQFEKLNAEDEKDVGGSHHDDDLLTVDDEEEPSRSSLFPKASTTRRGSAVSSSQGNRRLLEDDSRRYTRFLGTSRSASGGLYPSILKSSASKPKTKKRKHVQFKIDGEVHHPTRKLKEPKVKLEGKPTDLVKDLELSLREVEKQAAQELLLVKQRKDQETEKMIHGGARAIHTGARHRSSEDLSQNDAADDLQWVVDVLLQPATALVMFCAMGLLIAALARCDTLETGLNTGATTMASLEALSQNVERSEIAAAYFTNFGVSQHHVTFFAYVTGALGYDSARKSVVESFSSVTEDVVLLMERLTGKAVEVLVGLLDPMSLAARSLAAQGILDLSTTTTLATYESADRVVTPDFLRQYPNLLLRPADYVFLGTINTTAVASLTARQLEAVALGRLNSQLSASQNEAFADTLAKANEQTQTTLLNGARESADVVSRLSTAALALCACAMVAVLADAAFALLSNGSAATSSAWASHLLRMLLFGCCAIALATSIAARQSVDQLHSDCTQYLAAFNEAADTRSAFFRRQRFAFPRYLATDNNLTLYELSANYSASSVTAQYTSLLSRLQAIRFAQADLLTDALSTADQYFYHMQLVGIWLRAAAITKASTGSFTSPSSPPFLSSYNFATEVGSASDSVKYAIESAYQYTTSSADSLRNASDLEIMSRAATFGLRGFARYSAVYDALSNSVIHPLLAQLQDTISSDLRFQYALLRVAVAFAAAAGGLALWSTLAPLFRSTFANLVESAKLANAMMDALFSGSLRHALVALGILAAAMIAQFVVAILTTSLGTQAGQIVYTARDREQLVLQSVSTAVKMNQAAALGDGFEYAQMASKLNIISSKLSDARNALYFDDSATSTAFGVVNSLSSAQRAVTFSGGQRSLDSQFLQWLSLLSSLVNLNIGLATQVNPINPLANTYNFSAATKTAINTTTYSLINSYSNLVAALRSSNAQYDDDVKSAVKQSLIPDVILLAAVLLIIAAQIYLLFIPVTEQLKSQERGTRLMLNMIPQGVRDVVPKITMYLESGSLVEEDEEAKVYHRCETTARFLSMWSHVDDQQSCFDVLNESRMGQILIDVRGTVIFANKHVPDLLGYENLVGNNINIILEEPLRSLHDGFLKRFATQGTSRVVGSQRDAVALHKNGERVHLFLVLDEAVSFSGQQFFLGGIQRYNVEEIRGGKAQSNAAKATTSKNNASAK